MRAKRQKLADSAKDEAEIERLMKAAEREVKSAGKAVEAARRARQLARSEILEMVLAADKAKEEISKLKRSMEGLREELGTKRKASADAGDVRADVMQLKAVYDCKLVADEEASAAVATAASSTACYGAARPKDEVLSELDKVVEAMDKAEKRAEAIDKVYA